jgi:hypothetical protein
VVPPCPEALGQEFETRSLLHFVRAQPYTDIYFLCWEPGTIIILVDRCRTGGGGKRKSDT